LPADDGMLIDYDGVTGRMRAALPVYPDAGVPGVFSESGEFVDLPFSAPTEVPEMVPTSPTGEPITLHVNEVDVRKVLEMLSRQHGMNILVAPGVTGTVTANLQKVDERTALLAILKLCDLVAHDESGFTYVYPATAFPRSGFVTRIFPLDYASAEEVLVSVTGMLTPSGQAFTSISSAKDNRRTQEVIVAFDTPESMRRIEQYVAEMDHPPAQVVIEVHVFQVDLSDDERHGVNYQQLFNVANRDFEIDIKGFASTTESPGVTARLWGDDMDAFVECLKATNDAKTLASPKIMVFNEQASRIQIGERLGYKIITVTETAAVEEVKFLEVGVVLEVTPRVTRDGRVLMRIKPEVSSGVINETTRLPEETTTELETDVVAVHGLRPGTAVLNLNPCFVVKSVAYWFSGRGMKAY